MSTSPVSLSSLLARPGVRSFARPHRVAATCAMVEPLEDRQFFSAAPLLHAPAAPVHAQSALNVAKHADKIADKIEKAVDKVAAQLTKHPDKVLDHGVTSLIPLKIDAVKLVDGVLTAVGSLAGQAFSLPITLDTTPNPDPANDCPILDLSLGPINLDVLGLNVDTSKICLNITAEEGPGNLLGNLLCAVAGLLNGGGLLTGLSDLLNQILAILRS